MGIYIICVCAFFKGSDEVEIKTTFFPADSHADAERAGLAITENFFTGREGLDRVQVLVERQDKSLVRKLLNERCKVVVLGKSFDEWQAAIGYKSGKFVN